MHPVQTVKIHPALRRKVKTMSMSVMMAGIIATGAVISLSVKAEPLLMAFDEYMQRCMQTYGGDEVTEKVCETQYRAIEAKEAALTAQTDALTESIWSAEEGMSQNGDGVGGRQ